MRLWVISSSALNQSELGLIRRLLCIHLLAVTGFDELQHPVRTNVSSQCVNSLSNPTSAYLIIQAKWRERRKKLHPATFFISTSNTASHYLWIDRPQTPFHHRWTCKSLATKAAIFCTDSLFPSPWLRNSALHSAAFSGKKECYSAECNQYRFYTTVTNLIANYTIVSMCSLLKTLETRA
jgi:hypothetical protein